MTPNQLHTQQPQGQDALSPFMQAVITGPPRLMDSSHPLDQPLSPEAVHPLLHPIETVREEGLGGFALQTGRAIGEIANAYVRGEIYDLRIASRRAKAAGQTALAYLRRGI